LHDLWVVDVEPAPDAARLCAVVEAPRGADVEEVRVRLDRASGLLRSEVAQAITRKRAPVIAFRVIPAGGLGAEPAESAEPAEPPSRTGAQEDEA
jgi:ribosome-binding factor A